MTGKEFEDLIAGKLKDAGLGFERNPALGGVQPDFLVTGPHGQRVIIEAKIWDPRGGNTARALDQAERYKSATGADKVFVVLPELQRNFEGKGLVSADYLLRAMKFFFEESVPLYKRRPRPHRRVRNMSAACIINPDRWRRTRPHPSEARSVFAAMPFDREYDDTYFVAMAYAAEQVDAACTRVDREEFSGDVVDKIKRLIKSCIAVIVDLSEAKPNVLYEAGYAHALDKPTVHICSTPLSALPFDVRNWNTLEYTRGQTSKLREPLSSRLEAVLP